MDFKNAVAPAGGGSHMQVPLSVLITSATAFLYVLWGVTTTNQFIPLSMRYHTGVHAGVNLAVKRDS